MLSPIDRREPRQLRKKPATCARNRFRQERWYAPISARQWAGGPAWIYAL